MKVVGCKEAKEISLTRSGANPLAHVLIRKNMAPAQPNPSETPEMDAKIIKAMLALSDEAKAYVIGLDDAATTAFFAKSAEDQTAEVEKAKKKAPVTTSGENEPDADDMQKSIARLEKSFKDVAAENAELKKSLAERDATAVIEKRATDEFAGYPGGHAAAVSMLKSVQGLDEAGRKGVEDMMKSQIEMAKRVTTTVGLNEEEFAKAAPAKAELAKKAQEIAVAKSITVQAAEAEIMTDPQYGDLYSRVMAEERMAN